MNNHFKLVNLCEQVVEASTVKSKEDNQSLCPFCESTGYYSEQLSSIIHEPECAYLIAKKLLEENKTTEIRVAYFKTVNQ